MSVTNRLDEIEARANAVEIRNELLPAVRAYAASEGLSSTGAIQAGLRMGAEAALAAVPALVAALRAVLDRHPKGKASVLEYTAAGEVEHCLGCRGAHGIAHDEYGLVPWPCPTVQYITAALEVAP